MNVASRRGALFVFVDVDDDVDDTSHTCVDSFYSFVSLEGLCAVVMILTARARYATKTAEQDADERNREEEQEIHVQKS